MCIPLSVKLRVLSSACEGGVVPTMKILLAIDPSAASEAALDEVAVRPWPPGTTVEVLGVVDPSHFLEVPQLIDRVT